MRSDDDLVRQAQQGRLEAFDRLMVRYQRLVCKIAMGYVGEKEQALDVTQNVFLKVYRNLEAVRNDGMFKPWLLRIAYNESVNWLRKSRRTSAREEPLAAEPAAGPAGAQEARVLHRERQRLVLDSLTALNPKYRMAVELRYAEGLRIREIADTMGCSEGMVKSLLFRGVRRIRDHVAGSIGGNP